jgi:sugar O-acyltransferase (sialic acid O-acetyltransferase NeuD family)
MMPAVMVPDLIVLGASGLAREALAVVRETGSHHPIGVLDDAADTHGETVAGVPVIGHITDLQRYVHADVLVCIGSGLARERVVRWLVETGVRGIRFATVIDPSVRNPAGCPIGAGSIVLAGVAITADARIGEHVVIMPNVTITHDDVVGDYATLAAGVTLGGGVRVGRGAYLGMNSSVLPSVRIGERAVVGMAAAVLGDVPDDQTWAGVPARALVTRHSRADIVEVAP